MSARAGLPELAERALEQVRGRDPGLGAEVFLCRRRRRGLELREGRLEAFSASEEAGCGLRLEGGGRIAFASASGLGPESVEEAYRRAREQLPHLPADPHRVLPPPAPRPPGEDPSASIFDPALLDRPPEERLADLRAMHERALAADPRVRRVLHAGYGETLEETGIASTSGIRAFGRGTLAEAFISVAAESGGEVQVGSGVRRARGPEGPDFRAAADGAAERAARLLGARKLPTRRRDVLFDPWAAGEILELLCHSLRAEAVQRGQSLLKGRLGLRVAAPAVTLVDDPWRSGGLASAPFDGEGLPTSRKTMVREGVLSDLFHDSYTARKDGRESNGCAARAGFQSPPEAGASNFYLQPGAVDRDRLAAETPEGLLVLEVLGVHTADPVSGEFSIGVGGLALKGGEPAHAVRGAMLSGNILTMLERVDAVADDLVFYGRIAAPTFRVRDVTVA